MAFKVVDNNSGIIHAGIKDLRQANDEQKFTNGTLYGSKGQVLKKPQQFEKGGRILGDISQERLDELENASDNVDSDFSSQLGNQIDYEQMRRGRALYNPKRRKAIENRKKFFKDYYGLDNVTGSYNETPYFKGTPGNAFFDDDDFDDLIEDEEYVSDYDKDGNVRR